MLQLLKDYGPVLTFLLQAIWFALTWWFRLSVATKSDLSQLIDRVEKLEIAAESAPDAKDIESLRLEMAHHTGQMREFNAQLQGARETIGAQLEGIDSRIDGVTVLVKRAEKMLDTVTQHLLAQNK